MQAIILAAGKGVRLGKYTRENTKCMVDLNGTKIIDMTLDMLVGAGVSKVILVVGYKAENLIRHIKEFHAEKSIEFVNNPIYDKTNNIYSLCLAKEFLLSDDSILIESDLVFDQSILNRLLADQRPNIAVVDKFQAWMDGTVVTLDSQENITSFVPKVSFNYDKINDYYKTVNIYKFSRDFSVKKYVPFLEAYSQALGHNEYYEQVLRVIASLENKDLSGLVLNGEKWYEIDDIQDLDIAETIFNISPEDKLKKIQQRYGGYWRFNDLKDFCYLVNPYFPTAKLENEIKFSLRELISQYPSGLDIQNLLAAKLFGVDSGCITVGNGATELITAISFALPGKFGMMTPCFAEYPNRIGLDRMVFQESKSMDYAYDINVLNDLARKCDYIILVNPDNPSGHFLSKESILELARANRDKILILDESFVDFSDKGEVSSLLDQKILDELDNMVVVKSISKSYGVPGVRLGVVATSNKDILAKVKKNLSIWNINSFGEMFLQIIGKHKEDYIDSCRKIARERDSLFVRLSNISRLKVYASGANYFLCQILGPLTSTELTIRLLDEYSIYIKDLAKKDGFGDGEYVRIAVRDERDNSELVSALINILNG